MPLVLYDPGSAYHSRWAAQYVAADPRNRRSAPIGGTQGAETARNTLVQALRSVTPDHEILFAVGHGGAALFPDEGTVDLAPQRAFRLSHSSKPEVYVDPWYDYDFGDATGKSKKQNDQTVDPPGARTRLHHWAVYTSIGTAMRANQIYRVTFLTCRVGNALDFIRKISLDWNTLVKAYRRYVWFQIDGGTGRARAYLDGDAPGQGTNVPLGETQLPQVDFVTVGPPLAQPTQPAGH